MTESARFNQTRLGDIPERQKIAETLGCHQGIWGTMFILTAWLFDPGSPDGTIAMEWLMIWGAIAALGLGLAGYEVWKRNNRTVLARKGRHIAVYRRGRFDMELAPSEIVMVRAGIYTMLHLGAYLAVAAFFFIALAVLLYSMEIKDRKGTEAIIVILSIGLACAASLASAAWTRFTCFHLRVPVRGSKWREESVIVNASRLKELFPEFIDDWLRTARIA